jgi:hypothetical protein
MSRDPDGSTTIRKARAESTDMSRLVTTGQPHLIVIPVDSDVLIVPLGQLLDRSLDMLHASGFTHGFRAVVGVASRTIPVTLERLRVEGDLDTPLFGNTDKEVAGHPEMVTHGYALTRADLELPLGRHDFSIDTADVDPSVEASTIVGLDEVTSEDFPRA